MSDLNIRFSNCFDFINNTKQYLETNPTDWRNIYTEEELIRAECDLMEMELEALYDAEEYDSVLNGNAFRTSKRTQRRKQNKKHHKADRYHGKKLMVIRYKENHEIKEGLSWLYRDCHCPVGDDIKYSLNAITAREQDYFCTPSSPSFISKMEIEKEKCIEEEKDNSEDFLYDFLWYLIDTLLEEKYIMIYDYDNGQGWEDHEYRTNEFFGMMTKDEVITKLTKNFLWNEVGVDVNETELKGLKGISFNWDFGCDRWGWNGYENYTIIPVSAIY